MIWKEGFLYLGNRMKSFKTLAIVMIVAGTIGLAYGGFSYTKENHKAKIGSLELSVTENKTVNVPVWAGVTAIAIGGVMLLFGVTRRQSH